MNTFDSFTFEARHYVPEGQEQVNSCFSNCTGPWIMSAGRWDSHLSAATAAADWLKTMAALDPQQHEIRVVQVTELQLLINGEFARP